MSDLQIPEAAMPIVEILRRDVERPTAKIVTSSGDSLTAPRFECGKCPMGLHPTALSDTPALKESFLAGAELGRLNNSVANYSSPGYAFWTWWDYLTVEQAYEAVNLIWPEGK